LLSLVADTRGHILHPTAKFLSRISYTFPQFIAGLFGAGANCSNTGAKLVAGFPAAVWGDQHSHAKSQS
jgi:hypothetical protein